MLDPLFSSSFTLAEIKACVAEAEAFDTYVASHCYQPRDITRALVGGVKCIEHGQLIDEEAMKLLVEKGAFLSLNTAGFSPILFEHPNYARGTFVGKKLADAHKGSKDLIKLIKTYKPKVVHNIEKYGNTTAASIPLALSEAVQEGRAKKGDLILMPAFGSGFTWGAALVRL